MNRVLPTVWVLLILIQSLPAGGKTELTADKKEKAYILKYGHGAQEAHPAHVAGVRFAELINQRTKGKVEVQLYPDRQLGEERDMVEGLQIGTVDVAVISTGPLGSFVPEIGVVDLPFLFSSDEHAYKVLDGDIGQFILTQFEPKGILGISFWENGWRHLTTKRKVLRPEDLRGMKIRTMQNRVHMAAFVSLGASPVPMVWGNVSTALQQGIIDGQENPIVVVYSNALWKVQKYYALTSHFYGPHAVLGSKKNLEKLPKQYKEIIMQTLKELATYQRDYNKKIEGDMIRGLRENGMDVYELDRRPFQQVTGVVYQQFESQFGKDLIDRIVSFGKKGK
ncbi:MAG: TRAP transporter substrate-binding protein [Spirochaetales bacterium]